MKLTQKKCKPCEGNVPKLKREEAKKLLKEIPTWELRGEKIFKAYRFKNFLDSIAFVNRMADLAEDEGHHPNFAVNFKEVDVTIWTHAINGLSENDFILAAKLDEIA
ncbi:MAG: 4a-hydroxytetrahydrobiopterin dehydratase [Deltaproteobacteria bacterium]|nr:4a-hydroxytetrahydrobiopterin dehydratase [Deltaproteobacteria bacterium]